MDAAVADFQTHCVAPLAADACPVMAAEMAGLTRVAPPAGSGKGVMAWRTPGGGTLVIDALATNVCRVILPKGVAAEQVEPQSRVAVRAETKDEATVLVAQAGAKAGE
ncbi:MAG: hypothetical protein KJS97_14370 [Alphaproteobacteria bacterium]|nr:hypothetical protein [Alphaproteobacteria bacterium]